VSREHLNRTLEIVFRAVNFTGSNNEACTSLYLEMQFISGVDTSSEMGCQNGEETSSLESTGEVITVSRDQLFKMDAGPAYLV